MWWMRAMFNRHTSEEGQIVITGLVIVNVKTRNGYYPEARSFRRVIIQIVKSVC